MIDWRFLVSHSGYLLPGTYACTLALIVSILVFFHVLTHSAISVLCSNILLLPQTFSCQSKTNIDCRVLVMFFHTSTSFAGVQCWKRS